MPEGTGRLMDSAAWGTASSDEGKSDNFKVVNVEFVDEFEDCSAGVVGRVEDDDCEGGDDGEDDKAGFRNVSAPSKSSNSGNLPEGKFGSKTV